MKWFAVLGNRYARNARGNRMDTRFIILKACCVHKNVPVTQVSSTRRHCSYLRSSSGTEGAPTPALLNKTSSRQKVSCVAVNNADTASGSHTSIDITSVRAFGTPASWTVCSKSSTRRLPARRNIRLPRTGMQFVCQYQFQHQSQERYDL